MHFWTVTAETESHVKQLADEVGFRYALDPLAGDYAHTAVLVVLSPTGMVSRYLYGMSYPQRDLRLALVEAGEGKTGTSLDRFILTCFHYDADAQGYSLAILGIAKWIGGGLLALMVGFFAVVFRREARRQDDDARLADDDAARRHLPFPLADARRPEALNRTLRCRSTPPQPRPRARPSGLRASLGTTSGSPRRSRRRLTRSMRCFSSS